MSVTRLIIRELKHRSLNFTLSLAAVAIAVVCLAGALALLRGFDKETTALIDEMVAETNKEMMALEDSIRKQMKGLGFNIFIFPEGQDMSEVHAQGYASKTMPEDYVSKLAESKIVTVNHLLPSLTQKIKWPEQKDRTVVLIGIRGEVPKAHGGGLTKSGKKKKPLIDPVKTKHAVVGYELHKTLELKEGQKITLMGETFTIEKCHKERGSVDDITIWINLDEAQAMLDKPEQINAILALECNCAAIDRIGEVRAELGAILPGTKIIEKGSTALARAEARVTAEKTAMAQIAEVKEARTGMQAQREKLAAILVPLITAMCMAWIMQLTFANTRERRAEVGVLRAVGLRSSSVLTLFLGRAGIIGVGGALIGLALLFIGAPAASDMLAEMGVGNLINSKELLAFLLITPLLSCAAAWLPSLIASQQDPAIVLAND
jgi:ABC-type lipoprotein release transport system permease subunit